MKHLNLFILFLMANASAVRKVYLFCCIRNFQFFIARFVLHAAWCNLDPILDQHIGKNLCLQIARLQAHGFATARPRLAGNVCDLVWCQRTSGSQPLKPRCFFFTATCHPVHRICWFVYTTAKLVWCHRRRCSRVLAALGWRHGAKRLPVVTDAFIRCTATANQHPALGRSSTCRWPASVENQLTVAGDDVRRLKADAVGASKHVLHWRSSSRLSCAVGLYSARLLLQLLQLLLLPASCHRLSYCCWATTGYRRRQRYRSLGDEIRRVPTFDTRMNSRSLEGWIRFVARLWTSILDFVRITDGNVHIKLAKQKL